jgi:hypothetical protein
MAEVDAFGRDEEIALLDRAWANTDVNVLQSFPDWGREVDAPLPSSLHQS